MYFYAFVQVVEMVEKILPLAGDVVGDEEHLLGVREIVEHRLIAM